MNIEISKFIPHHHIPGNNDFFFLGEISSLGQKNWTKIVNSWLNTKSERDACEPLNYKSGRQMS